MARQVPRVTPTMTGVVAALQRVAQSTRGPLTVLAYEATRQGEEPSAAKIQKLTSSWPRALHLAGLEDRMSRKARYRIASGEVTL